MSKTNPQVDQYVASAKKWREETATLRALILDFPLTEELKWGKPCYTFQETNLLIIQGFKDYCALMFCKGALLKDPKKLLHQPGENTQSARQLRFTSVQEITAQKSVLKACIQETIAAEKAGLKVEYKKTAEYAVPEELEQKFRKTPSFKKAFEALTPGRQRGYLLHFSAAKQSATRAARIEKCTAKILAGQGLLDYDRSSVVKKPKPVSKEGVTLLSGGNPQIAKADGDAPVQAYIAAMPGWKSGLGRRLDDLITRTVPHVQKAVRWNSPFYGLEGKGWFLSFHVLTRCVKVTFFAGQSLKPLPPGGTERSQEARWIDLHETDGLDEKQFTSWVKQAATLPGWTP